jgi:hypothetical protein
MGMSSPDYESERPTRSVIGQSRILEPVAAFVGTDAKDAKKGSGTRLNA